MSLKHRLLSLFFVVHLVAITVGAIASPGAVVPVGPPRHPTNNVVAASVTPVLDRAAARVFDAFQMVQRGIAPLQPLATTYLDVTGVAQSWKMFSNPPTTNQYLRVRYYIGSSSAPGSAAWTATELVLPAHREDRLRIVRGYWDAYSDKALTSALQRFHANRERIGEHLLKPETRSADLPDDIAPVGRYFARRFARRALAADERIVRFEIWYGVSPIPLPGEALTQEQLDARRRILEEYYAGPVEDRFPPASYPPYHVAQIEADILWSLEYFEP